MYFVALLSLDHMAEDGEPVFRRRRRAERPVAVRISGEAQGDEAAGAAEEHDAYVKCTLTCADVQTESRGPRVAAQHASAARRCRLAAAQYG